MKVLFVSNWYPTKTRPISGVFIKEHAVSIKQQGVDILVLNLILEKSKKIFEKRVIDFVDENGIRTVQIIISSILKDAFYYLPSFQYTFLKQTFYNLVFPVFQPDIIHSNVVYTSGLMAKNLSKTLNIPYIITEHWSKIKYMLQKPILSSDIKYTYKKSARILPVSEFLKNSIIQQIPSIKQNKFEVIPNIVDNKIFTYQTKQKTFDTIHFCAIATWATKNQPDKFPELFIEALDILQKTTNKKIILTMIGGGNRLLELQNLCKEKSFETVFKGFMSKTEIVKILHCTDIFLHASLTETFGIVTLEALFTGTPAICSNVGALPELINNTNGILCENTVESWVKAIEKSINTKYDNKKISDDVYLKFGSQQVGKKIIEVYKSVLNV